MSDFTLHLTEAEAKTLRLLLSLDMDAIGLERSDQARARSIKKKLKKDPPGS